MPARCPTACRPYACRPARGTRRDQLRRVREAGSRPTPLDVPIEARAARAMAALPTLRRVAPQRIPARPRRGNSTPDRGDRSELAAAGLRRAGRAATACGRPGHRDGQPGRSPWLRRGWCADRDPRSPARSAQEARSGPGQWEVTGQWRAEVGRGDGNRGPGAPGQLLLRIAVADLHAGRQQHAHVQAAAAQHEPSQLIGAAPDRRRRLGTAADDPCRDAAPPQRLGQRLFDQLEVADRADRGEAEAAGDEKDESGGHGCIVGRKGLPARADSQPGPWAGPASVSASGNTALQPFARVAADSARSALCRMTPGRRPASR